MLACQHQNPICRKGRLWQRKCHESGKNGKLHGALLLKFPAMKLIQWSGASGLRIPKPN
jgi:hypothetical protein